MKSETCDVCGEPRPADAGNRWKRHAGECTRRHEVERFRKMREKHPLPGDSRGCNVCRGRCRKRPDECARIASELLIALRPTWDWRDMSTTRSAGNSADSFAKDALSTSSATLSCM